MLCDDVGKIDDDNGGRVGSSNKERAELVLVSLSNLYLLLEFILVDASGPFSCSTSHHLLTTLTTNYCPNQICILISLKRECILQMELIEDPTISLYGQITREYYSMKLLHEN